MVQVENEYGSFGDDTVYLAHLRDGLIARGIEELLVTSDGPARMWLTGGTVEEDCDIVRHALNEVNGEQS